mmetsp:Transcript_13820/g.21560  ORF Transcript_13820/g.21560 Transcript_13820/m.21560 type:complete len:275 (+) Transcript_13820:389-1213(+)|eukprot:CAMPEP_0170506566 /NCGR_PEP_ID=MMETSP0208-20121228/55365_1 /TAXON_ID=197538 /ORGANISM="Strombidium inclinatum, Strain S3" /LENGTH=274 /DNA_ID=CAMNT_0010788175 /DNA_START=381 /DNA_END=1205 /DNA_ORIENTATION=-
MCTLLLKGLTLPGCKKGIEFFFVPDWSRLLELAIWKEAFIQVLYSSTTFFGITMFYSGSREAHQSVIKASLSFCLADSATSIFAGITLFSYLGHVAESLEVEVKDLILNGYNLAFVAYPGLLTTLSFPNLWAILLFSMFFLIGIDSQFGMIDMIVGYACDFAAARKLKLRKEIVVMITLSVCFLMSIIYTTKAGFWWFNLFRSYAAGDSLLFVALVECSSIIYSLGIEKLEALMKEKTGEVFPSFYKFSLKYLCLPIIGAIATISVHKEINLEM